MTRSDYRTVRLIDGASAFLLGVIAGLGVGHAHGGVAWCSSASCAPADGGR